MAMVLPLTSRIVNVTAAQIENRNILMLPMNGSKRLSKLLFRLGLGRLGRIIEQIVNRAGNARYIVRTRHEHRERPHLILPPQRCLLASLKYSG